MVTCQQTEGTNGVDVVMETIQDRLKVQGARGGSHTNFLFKEKMAGHRLGDSVT